jgi:hypothetical protein
MGRTKLSLALIMLLSMDVKKIKMKKYNKILLGILLLVAISSIPALVKAAYVPADDDNLPDYYYVDLGENMSGDLEDMIYDDLDAYYIESQRISLTHYAQIRIYFYYDLYEPDSEGISIDFFIDECGDSDVEISAYGDVDGWMSLGTHSEGGHNIALSDYNYDDQVISVIKFYKSKWGNDFELNIDLANLDFA